MKEEEKIQMRKRNMRLFPTYKKLAWDYIFFYTINFLFLTQVKGINPKLWKFNEYNFQRMPEDDEVYTLLCSFDDVDFDKYFSY